MYIVSNSVKSDDNWKHLSALRLDVSLLPNTIAEVMRAMKGKAYYRVVPSVGIAVLSSFGLLWDISRDFATQG